MITRVETVAVYVGDQQRALDFYTKQVGFELRKDIPFGPVIMDSAGLIEMIGPHVLLCASQLNPVSNEYSARRSVPSRTPHPRRTNRRTLR